MEIPPISGPKIFSSFHKELVKHYEDTELVSNALSSLANTSKEWKKMRKALSEQKNVTINPEDQRTLIKKIEMLRPFQSSENPIVFADLKKRLVRAYGKEATQRALSALRTDQKWKPLMEKWEQQGVYIEKDYQDTIDIYVKTVAASSQGG